MNGPEYATRQFEVWYHDIECNSGSEDALEEGLRIWYPATEVPDQIDGFESTLGGFREIRSSAP